MVDIRKKIAIAMILKDMEINDLVQELGISRGYLSPIINGKRTGERPEELLNEVKEILELDNLVVHYKKEKESL